MSENKEYIVTREEKGRIHISEEVIASIAAAAAMEVDGVSGLSSTLGPDGAHRLSPKNMKRGVRISQSGDSLRLDVGIFVAYGHTIPQVAEKVQAAVRASVENSTGRHVGNVHIYVGGVTLEKPKA